jgi:hypothetical protein
VLTEGNAHHFADQHHMRRHDLELDKPAIEGGKRVLQHRRAGHQFLPVPHGETLFRGKRGVAAGKGVGKVDLVGSQRVKRKAAALFEDRIFRVGGVDTGEHHARVVRHRTGSRDRHAPFLALMRRRHDLHMPGIAAHGIAIERRIHQQSVQHGILL